MDIRSHLPHTQPAADPDDQCATPDHSHVPQAFPAGDERAMDRASRIFRALGDPARLRLAARLAQSPSCVSSLAADERESMTTISQRLRVLRADNIVGRRRQGKHILYSLADQHMAELIANALAHAAERPSTYSPQERNTLMPAVHEVHENHTHQHSENCGHTAIQHDDHVDYLHDGHLHHMHEGHIDEHTLEVSASNPDDCTEGHDCSGHEAGHQHGPSCGHEALPHGGHTDYLVEGHLHHAHNGHCDNHGSVEVIQ